MRFHIAGSADTDIDLSLLSYAHQLVKQLSRKILSEGGGLVITVGPDPVHQIEPSLPIIFDWTILEALDECQKLNLITWPEAQGAPVVAVGLPKWKEKIPDRRIELWERLESSDNLQLVQVDSELGVGGILREKQASFGDILITLGGGPGVNHFVELYLNKKRPVIPLDLPLKKDRLSASEKLSIKAMENPNTFFKCQSTKDSTRAFSRLTLKKQIEIDEFEKRFFNFISRLSKPKAFYVRLLNKDVPEFEDIENYFRNIVDVVIETSGYERFESGLDPSEEPFLNEEIFKNLHYSSLAVVDLTGIRSNCCLELGYSLGQKKKVILMAKKGTKLPFDTKMIPCHFWSVDEENSKRIKNLIEFMEHNINRKPLVS